VIGATSRFGEEPDDRPVQYRDVFATLYHNLGLDIHNTAVTDSLGRPHYLFEGHEPFPELVYWGPKRSQAALSAWVVR
jgi:hypothetical protein